MRKLIPALYVFVLLFMSACGAPAADSAKSSGNAPVIDFTAPAEPLNVTVTLDDASTTSGTITPEGGSLELTAADGSVYNLEIPAKALEADTVITMTAVKSIEGAPLDGGEVAAVQLEPSGLFFKELLTLTVSPATEIPIRNQVAFGYEGTGRDYHLAVVDPHSKDIKIKLMQFSGAGVGSASDKAWAANLSIQASGADTRIWQKIGEFSLAERQKNLLGAQGDVDQTDWVNQMKSALDQLDDQVVLKERAAAELDCKYAAKAAQHLLETQKLRKSLGIDPMDTNELFQKLDELGKIIKECTLNYIVSGESNQVSFSGTICGLDKPFVIDATFPGGGSAKTTFTPNSVIDGTTSVTGGGAGCVQTGGGKYTVAIEADSASITWTTTDTLTCPQGNDTRTGSFTLPMQPAPAAACAGR